MLSITLVVKLDRISPIQLFKILLRREDPTLWLGVPCFFTITGGINYMYINFSI